MQIRSILSPRAIVVGSKASNKSRLFKEIGQIGSEIFGVDAEILSDSLQNREKLGSTGMGHGVAIPHARLQNIDQVHGIFIKLEHPIDFESQNKGQVDLVFALFAPINEGSDHLKALARVSRILRDDSTRENLRTSNEAEAIFAILTENMEVVAA